MFTLETQFMKNKKIVICGGTGFIGQGIGKYFGQENDIIILSRGVRNHENNNYNSKLLQPANGNRIRYIKWNGKTVEQTWAKEIEGADIIINLAGKSVNCRYHQRQMQEIFDSRTNPTQAIGEAIRNSILPPRLWINAASATIYRHAPDHPQDEFIGEISEAKADNMPWTFLDRLRLRKNKFLAKIIHGKNSEVYKNLDLDFSVRVCKKWEKTFFEHRTPFTRKIALRTAITLGEGGVITPYLNLCKFGLGGRHGNGNQMFSWVHIEDVCRMIEWLYENKEAEGIYNCVAPQPITNKYLMKALRNITGNKIGLPAPAWLLELGAWIIGTETELMLKSRWVSPARGMQEGFQFRYETVDDALGEIISRLPRKAYRLF